MTHKICDIGVATQIGAYSDAVETAPNLKWLFTSGTPGLETTGAHSIRLAMSHSLTPASQARRYICRPREQSHLESRILP